MLITEINAIGETAFYAYSLNRTIDVIETLEKLNWSDIRDKNLEENNDFYSRLLDIVNDKVTNNIFVELTDDAEGKNHLLLRVLRIRTSISQYRLLFLRDDVETKILSRVESAKTDINSIVTGTQDSIQKMSTDVQNSINDHLTESEAAFEETIKEEIKSATGQIEPQLITTILTLMGVFSAVITIIMSVVITSSSWLNNADGASAVIAFIIPNLVVIFSIVILLGMVFSRRDSKVVVISENTWDLTNLSNKALKKARATQKITALMIAIFTIAIVAFSLYEIRVNAEPHVRYILSQGMYECVEIQVDESETPVRYIEFQFNEKIYTFPYDEGYFHDGKLHFCEEHESLE